MAQQRSWFSRAAIRRLLLGGAAVLALVLLAAGLAGAAAAARPDNAAAVAPPPPKVSDDFDRLPAGLKGLSYSTLVNAGFVHVTKTAPAPGGAWRAPWAPLLNIVWGLPHVTGAGSGEPATGMHPTNFLDALVSGNVSIDNTTNGGTTWQVRNPPNAAGYGDVVNGWLQGASGGTALEVALNPSSDGADMTCGMSTDFGVTWTNFAACSNTLRTTFFDDREYIWVDRTPSSPYYGRVYVTNALFDPAGSGSFNTVTNRWSSDNGATWNPPSNQPIAIVDSTEFARGVAHNEYPSLGISPNGTLGYVWHRGACCSTINVPNKVMFARSSDGGVTFPYSTTIVTVPLNQTVSFNSTSPFGQRWSDTPNVAADPSTNGVYYAIWTQYRTANSAASAAVYLSKTTDNGVTWSTPVIPYNNPNGNIFQGFGWVKVTADHTIHVTFLSGTTSNTTCAQLYVQSTDGGATWSAPFQLNTNNITTFASTTDYEAMDVTLSGGPGAIIAGWDDGSGHNARMGLFTAGTPTPTVTGTPPTNTPTYTPSNTPTATNTPCGGQANYTYSTGTATMVAGVDDTGNHCDDCLTEITLPFPFQIYDQIYSSANVSSNGQLDFLTGDLGYLNACLPDATASYAIFPHWDDMRTDTGTGCTSYASGCGVFTSTSGSAPNRIFNIEWRAALYSGAGPVNFEVRLYENPLQPQFDLVYGTLFTGTGSSATVGAQKDTGSMFVQVECNTGGINPGELIHFTRPMCGTPGPSPTPTSTPICATNYTYTTGTATIVPATTYVAGSSCNACVVPLTLPFAYSLYGTSYTSAMVSNKGVLEFTGNSSSGNNDCLPTAQLTDSIMAYWDDLNTFISDQMGVYTRVEGTAPNRIFDIEWRSGIIASDVQPHFEIRLYEGHQHFDVVYGQTRGGGYSATIGVQHGTGAGGLYTQFSCNQQGAIPAGGLISFQRVGCALP